MFHNNYISLNDSHNTKNTTETTYKTKKTFINIDSFNRSKQFSFKFYTESSLPNNALIFDGTETVKIYYPNNKLDVNKNYQIIFQNIEPDNPLNNTACNYPVNKLNFNQNLQTNIFTIEKFTNIETTTEYLNIENENVKTKSDYFQIKIQKLTSIGNLLKSGNTGGSNMKIKVIKSKTEIYPKENQYQINLGKIFKNVLSIRLISTEIPNVSYTVNVNSDEKNNNNKIYWLNEDEDINIIDKELIQDHVFLNSIDRYNLINSEQVNAQVGLGTTSTVLYKTAPNVKYSQDISSSYTLAELNNIIINDNTTQAQLDNANNVITAIHNNVNGRLQSYKLLTSRGPVVHGLTQVISSSVDTTETNLSSNDLMLKVVLNKSTYIYPDDYFNGMYIFIDATDDSNTQIVPIYGEVLDWVQSTRVITITSNYAEGSIQWKLVSDSTQSPISPGSTSSTEGLRYKIFESLDYGIFSTAARDTAAYFYQPKERIDEWYKLNRFYTPPKLFDNRYYLKNQYHSMGKTLVHEIQGLIDSTSETTVKTLLPFEYRYYKSYYNKRLRNYLSSNRPQSNYIKFLGYQIYDNILESSLGMNSTKNNSMQTFTTEINSMKRQISPKILLKGSEIIPQSVSDSEINLTANVNTIYPLYSVNIPEGIYLTEQLLDEILTQFNKTKTMRYDWLKKEWVPVNNLGDKFVTQTTSNNNRFFEIEYDTNNSIVEFRQYKRLTYHSSLQNKLIDERENYGKLGLYVIVNEGLPEICIRKKGHTFKNGDLVKIDKCRSIFNIPKTDINKVHKVKVYPVFRIHYRNIYPIPASLYFRVTNNVTYTHSNLTVHQIDPGNSASQPSNISQEYNVNNPDVNFEKLVQIYGYDTLSMLNKGTVQGMLNYIGSKFNQNFYDTNMPYNAGYYGHSIRPSTKDSFSKYTAESTQFDVHNPENSFIPNELFLKYSQMQGNSNTITLGRVIRTENYADQNGNFIMDFELITDENEKYFTVGDIIVGMESNTIAMILPYYWDEVGFPSKDVIASGHIHYITQRSGNIIQNSFVGENQSRNEDISNTDYYGQIYGTHQMDRNWFLMPVENGTESFSIEINTIPNSSDINGIQSNVIEISVPSRFTMLWGLNNTLKNELGFRKNFNGNSKEITFDNKYNFNFRNSVSNTIRSQENNIKQTKFVKLYDNQQMNHLMVECFDRVTFNVGDEVYFDNHTINKFQEKTQLSQELLIKKIFSVKDWVYQLEAKYYQTRLDENTDFSLAIDGGSVETNAEWQMRKVWLQNIKKWVYQNIKIWTNYNNDYYNYVINNYYFPRTWLNMSSTGYNNQNDEYKIAKVYVQEKNGSGLSSKSFVPGLPIYNHSGGLVGLKVLGITKPDKSFKYNMKETVVTSIDQISNNDYYYIYFVYGIKVSGVASDMTANVAAIANEHVLTSYVPASDENTDENLRNASATVSAIPSEESATYSLDASEDYLWHFYFGNKTVLEYKTPLSKKEEETIHNFNLTIDEKKLRYNPFTGNEDFGEKHYLTYNPSTHQQYGYEYSGADFTTDKIGPFAKVNGTSTVTVSHENHGLFVDDTITITNANVDHEADYRSNQINKTTKILKVINANSYEIDLGVTATASGNFGGRHTIVYSFSKTVDVNYNALPVTTIEPGESLQVYNHQKLIPKYYSESDVVDSDPRLLNVLKNTVDDDNVVVSVDNVNNKKLVGIKDGNYKALINLWPGTKEEMWRWEGKNLPGNTIVIDLDWNEDIANGFANQGGKIRVRKTPIPICGENEYEYHFHNKFKDTPENDLRFMKTRSTSNDNEYYSAFSTLASDYSAGVSSITVVDATPLTVPLSSNVDSYGLVLIESTIKSKYTSSELPNTEQNKITEWCLVTAITNNTLTLKHSLLNSHKKDATVILKGRVRKLYSKVEYGGTFIQFKAPSSSPPLQNGEIITISMNDFDTSKSKGDVGYYREQINRITSDGTENSLENGNSTYTYNIENSINKSSEFSAGNYVIIWGTGARESKKIHSNYLSTQNILIEGEWYTKIFYKGAKCMESEDGEWDTGFPQFNKYACKEVYIRGMKGLSLPDISFEKRDIDHYTNLKNTDNSDFTKTSFHIDQINPVPDGFYTLFPNTGQDDSGYLLTDNLNVDILGDFYECPKTPFEKEQYWREEGYSMTFSPTSANLNLNNPWNYIDIEDWGVKTGILQLNYHHPDIHSNDHKGFIPMKYLDVYITKGDGSATRYKLRPRLDWTTVVKDAAGYSGQFYQIEIKTDSPYKLTATTDILEVSYKGFRKSYETARSWPCIVIKGKYKGYGGFIEFRDKKNILQDLENGFKVTKIVKDSNNRNTNKFFINLDKKQTDFIKNYKGTKTVPTNVLYQNLDLLESNKLIEEDYPVGLGGVVYKKIRDSPVNVENDYINLCIKSRGNSLETTKNTSLNTIDDIFAKILLPGGPGNIFYNSFVSTPKIYNSPIKELSSLEISFRDKENKLIEFNGYDHSFTIEIEELVDSI